MSIIYSRNATSPRVYIYIVYVYTIYMFIIRAAHMAHVCRRLAVVAFSRYPAPAPFYNKNSVYRSTSSLPARAKN